MRGRSHALDHILGARLVSTLSIRPRRKTKAELDAMPIEDRLLYEAAHPLTDAEKMEQMEHELAWADYDLTGEVDPQIILANDPPPDWGE